MNFKCLGLLTGALLSAILLAAAGCSSPRSLDTGVTIVDSNTETATVESVDAATRTVVLKREDGHLHSYKLGPQVINFDQIAAGDTVKATLSESTSFFLLKNGPPPSLDSAVMVSRAAKGERPAAMSTQTLEEAVKVVSADPSRRLLTLRYENGKEKTFKTPRDLSLKGVQPGDDMVLRITDGQAIQVEKP